jgi:peptide deformylase
VLDVSYAEDEDKREPFILFNPVITHSSGEVMDEEGCLSFPGINGQVIRPETITVSAINIKGEPFILKDADGLLARCIQHEMDHLNGVLFVDKFSDSDKWINQGKLKKLVKKSRGT